MYFLTTIIAPKRGDEENHAFDSRTFGYFVRFPDAVAAAETNRGEMNETIYNYLVIEKIGGGIHSFTESEFWYKWAKNKWISCQKPKWSEGMTNWAIG
jgi:hypothetical protein